MDLHKKYGQYFVDVEGTKPVETRLDNDPSQIKRFFDAFDRKSRNPAESIHIRLGHST